MEIYSIIPQRLDIGASPTFVGATFSGLTAGSVLFAGTGGVVDDDASCQWDNVNKKFIIGSADASDQIEIYHDNTNAWMKWNDGSFNFVTDEGDNTDTLVNIRGKGTGYGIIRTYDQNNAEYMAFACLSGIGYLSVGGTSPAMLRLQDAANAPITMFRSATEGQTPIFGIYGFGSGSGGQESLDISVEQYAANTAEFYGLDTYHFEGEVDAQTIFKVAGTQVVGARAIDARCDDAINSGDATTDGVIDSLRDAMITHGLIAAT